MWHRASSSGAVKEPQGIWLQPRRLFLAGGRQPWLNTADWRIYGTQWYLTTRMRVTTSVHFGIFFASAVLPFRWGMTDLIHTRRARLSRRDRIHQWRLAFSFRFRTGRGRAASESPAFRRNGPVFFGTNYQNPAPRIRGCYVTIKNRLFIQCWIDSYTEKFEFVAGCGAYFS